MGRVSLIKSDQQFHFLPSHFHDILRGIGYPALYVIYKLHNIRKMEVELVVICVCVYIYLVIIAWALRLNSSLFLSCFELNQFLIQLL